MMFSLMALDGKEEMSGSGLSLVLIFMHCLLLCCNQVEQIPCQGTEIGVGGCNKHLLCCIKSMVYHWISLCLTFHFRLLFWLSLAILVIP